MKSRKYECCFCGLYCKCETTLTPNRCIQYSAGFAPAAKWEKIEPKKRQIRKCQNCDYGIPYSDGLYCSLSGDPADKVCKDWEEIQEL